MDRIWSGHSEEVTSKEKWAELQKELNNSRVRVKFFNRFIILSYMQLKVRAWLKRDPFNKVS